MDEGSILGSLDRIEAAIARIESAARDRPTRAPPPSAAAPTAAPAHDADLERRHAVLKTTVEQALARLDILIADQA